LGDTIGIANGLERLAAVARAGYDYAAARAQYEEAEQLYQKTGEIWKQGRCLTQLARMALAQGEYTLARTQLEEAERLYQTLGVQERLTWVHHLQAKAFLLAGDDLARAQKLGEQAVALARAGKFKACLAYALNVLGQIHLKQGQPDLARDLIEESVAILTDMGDRGGIGEALPGLAQVLIAQGDAQLAIQHVQEELALIRQIRLDQFVPDCLEVWGAALAGQGDLERAATLWGAAAAWRAAHHLPIAPAYRADHEQAVAGARAQIGESVFVAAWEHGQATPLDRLLA